MRLPVDMDDAQGPNEEGIRRIPFRPQFKLRVRSIPNGLGVPPTRCHPGRYANPAHVLLLVGPGA